MTARGPLLVYFFEAGELASSRELARVDAWATRYAGAGLTTLGVHSPRSGLARSSESLSAAVGRLGTGFPIANDADYRVWHAYGCKGWPSLFLWGRGGTLRWFHFGSAGIGETEAAIREELAAGEEERPLPEPVGGEERDPDSLAEPSGEVFPGGSHESPWVGDPGEPLEIEYAGGGCWVALDGRGRASVAVDGDEPRGFEVSAPGLYELSRHPEHGMHEVRLETDEGIRVWSAAFAPAPERG